MKKADENEKENKLLTKLEGVEGFWYEQPDILSKYQRRDDRLEKISYSQYGKMIRTGGKMTDDDSNEKGGIDEESYEGDEDNEELNNKDEDSNLKFHYKLRKKKGLARKYLNILN